MSLSKNVMNMKFMQRASVSTETNEDAKESTKTIRDDSEWSLPNNPLIRSSLKRTVQVKSIGYGSINMVQQNDDENDEDEEEEGGKNRTKEDKKTNEKQEKRNLTDEVNEIKRKKKIAEDKAKAFLRSVEQGTRKRKSKETEEEKKKKRRRGGDERRGGGDDERRGRGTKGKNI